MKNKHIRFLAILCACVFLLASFQPAVVLGADNEDDAESTGKVLRISTAEQLRQLAQDCRKSGYSAGLVVMLKEDIDLGGEPMISIPSFSGIFYGNGHTISGYVCSTNGSHQGLFRYLESTAQVHGLNLVGDVSPTGSRCDVGGIAGSNYGSILNCTFTGTVDGLVSVGGIAGENFGTIRDCEVSGTLSGKHFTGGIVGYNEGVIQSCTNRAQVNIEIREESLDFQSFDIKDIVGINLVSSTDSDSVSDTGGIVGISSGEIHDCLNHGAVGYPHFGYNVGGIAGRQSGFLTGCDNYGAVFGRKDVGGIAGQMEPYLILNDSTSLEREIQALQSSVNQAMSDMDANSADLGSSTEIIKYSGMSLADLYKNQNGDDQKDDVTLEDVINKGQEIGGQVGDEAGQVAGNLGDETIDHIFEGNLNEDDYVHIGQAGAGLVGDTTGSIVDRVEQKREEEAKIQEAQNAALRAQYAALGNGLNAMGNTIHNTISDLAQDMRGVSGHFSNILAMFSNAVSGNMQLTLMTDISELDTDELTEGKVLSCTNHGSVSGDTNVGGITGSMGVEAEFDMEGILSSSITDSITISKDTYYSRCIIRKCLNEGMVNAKKDYAGGVCGLGEMGVISRAENYGDVLSTGNYSGGIVGQSKSLVNESYAMCKLEGSEYVGGIAGQGQRVTLCSSMVNADENTACSGAICGWVDNGDENLYVLGNTYVSSNLGGIDGISYDGVAESVSYDQLVKNKDLPARFRTLKVIFRADDQVVQEVEVAYGGSLEGSQFPAVPKKEGCVGFWPQQSVENLTASAVVDAIYLDRLNGLSAENTREGSPLSIVLVEGMFEPSAGVTLRECPEAIGEDMEVLEAWEMGLSSSGAKVEPYKVHYLRPTKDGKPLACKILAVRENGTEELEYTEDGSYLVFENLGSTLRFCVLAAPESQFPLLPVCLGAGVVAAAGILAAALIRRRKKTAAEKTETGDVPVM